MPPSHVSTFAQLCSALTHDQAIKKADVEELQRRSQLQEFKPFPAQTREFEYVTPSQPSWLVY